MTSITCPSCGAQNALPNPAVVSMVCPYCDNISYIDKEGVKLTGKQSRLSEGFSRLFRGATGTLLEKNFVVRGRVRYAFDRGFWDEWYIEWEDGTTSWLTEDNHQFSLQKEVTVPQSTISNAQTIGSRFTALEDQYQIMEVGNARCLGIEGALPKGILPDETYRYIDGISLDGTKSIGLEYDDGEGSRPRVFIGTWIEHNKLQMEENNYAW
jgi:hypothetical protein